MFSVIIPLYNKQYSIQNTIKSVLCQTFQEFEIIVINDGSTDGSCKQVEEFDDSRIRLIHKINGGVSSARNTGIKEAINEWIVFLDGDDLWENNHLATLHKSIELFPKHKVFCTSFRIEGRVNVEKSREEYDIIGDYFVEATKKNFFWTSVACIHKSVFSISGMFNEKLNRGEDLELWARIGKKNEFIRCKLITATYQVLAENRSDKIKYDISKSYLSLIDLTDSELSSSEKKYQKSLLINAIKRFLRKRMFKEVLFLSRNLF